jgi:hypothetical protein
MNRISVSSSNISSIGYDPTTQVLEVEFNDGSIYQYDGVPQSVYDDFINASSHGQYLHQHIKDVYPHRKIR